MKLACTLLLIASLVKAQEPEELVICEAPEGDVHFEEHLEKLGNYCVNGGTCKTSVGPNTLEMCDCPEGLAGPHCEFEAGVVPPCARECFNDGVCQVGLKYWDEPVINTMEDLSFCICKDGFSGPYCEIEDITCNDHHCKNGGTCVSVKDDDGHASRHCDCTTAGDEENKFTGTYCELPATSTCDIDHNGHTFCTNGGVCRADSFMGCDCPVEFVGPVCEFKDRGIVPEPCDTQCMHDGICRQGAKDTSFLSRFGIHHRHLQAKFNSAFEHCVCPSGYAGVHCEYQIDVCPGEQHACMNGGECQPFSDQSGFAWHCNCQRASDEEHLYAGNSCEFKSTSYCTIDGQQPTTGTGHEAFCVNQGKCKGFVMGDREHPGCECPTGFYGDHCEFFDETALLEREKGTESSDKKEFLPWTLIAAGFVATMLVVSLYISRRKRARRNKKHGAMVSYINNNYDNNYSDTPSPIAPTLSQVNEGWIYSEADADSEYSIASSQHTPSIRNSSQLHLDDESIASTISDRAPNGAVSLMRSNFVTSEDSYDPDGQAMI